MTRALTTRFLSPSSRSYFGTDFGRLIVAVDGGGTGCRAVLADESGTILGYGEAGPANIVTDLEGAVTHIVSATNEAIAAGLGATPDGLISTLTAAIGLAGANVPERVQAISSLLPFAKCRIETDGHMAVKGALRDNDGVVAAIGTGSVFLSQRGGTIRQVGGWGLVLGDQASGAWLGRSLLIRTLEAIDGFRAMTPLLAQTSNQFHGRAGIISFAASALPADFAKIAPVLFGSDDESAITLLEQADAEITSSLYLAAGRYDSPTVFVGGIGHVFRDRLRHRLNVIEPAGTQIDGAVRTALSMLAR